MFVDINKNRKNVSALELFFAELAAETGGAADVLQAAKAAGIRIPKYPGSYKVNDTIAVGALHGLVAAYVDVKVQVILTTVAAGGFRPISAAQIKAVECLLTDREFAPLIDSGDLAAFLKSTGTTLDGEAKRFAATHGVPFWKALASVWFQKCKKRRAKPADPIIASKQAAPAPAKPASVMPTRTIVPYALPTQRNVTAAVCGDPAPGRSALDQRKASA
jgi:hypothetical protein